MGTHEFVKNKIYFQLIIGINKTYREEIIFSALDLLISKGSLSVDLEISVVSSGQILIKLSRVAFGEEDSSLITLRRVQQLFGTYYKSLAKLHFMPVLELPYYIN